jgi:histidinol-phosphatase (PHP family)
MTFERVSIHGGHSGQFCNHAHDSLEAIVQAYIEQQFTWVGLTEHMPPPDDRFLYPEEKQAGLTAGRMLERFGGYMAEARRLQAAYADRIEIHVGFESEGDTSAHALARRLIDLYVPDYIVGSVHHIRDIAFDYSPAEYRRAFEATGDMTALYCEYFDRQYAMLQALRPQVVAHFDLIRIFDPDYCRNLSLAAVMWRIQRNLELIRELDLILDFNVAALRKGAHEPYLSRPLLEQAHRMGIAVVPADDAHSVATVGSRLDEGIRLLQAVGFDGHWRKPGGCGNM